jgi:hypothetical protein
MPKLIETSSEQKQCFVIMGFGVKTDLATGRKLDLDKSYRLLIKPVIEGKGITCMRADEIRHSGAIDMPMYNELLTADLVIADLSTANSNAIYQLGIRHALRPYATIVISEDKLQFPFDVAHMLIQTYHHLGDAIDYDEIVRFRKTLEEMVDDVLSRQRTDSPVYAFLKGLTPPSLETSAGEKKAVAIVDQGEKDVKQETKDRTQATLTEQGEQAIKDGRFSDAKSLFALAQSLLSGEDIYISQRLVLATYKAGQPTLLEALHEARFLLENRLLPKESTDIETLRLLGDIEFALFNETQDIDRLTRARQAYERLYALNPDYQSGITLAYILTLHAEHRRDRAEKLVDIMLANRLRREVIELGKVKLADIEASFRTEVRLTGVSKAAEDAAQAKFEVWLAIAEAYYGLGQRENYQSASNEASLIRGSTSTLKALQSRIANLDPLVATQEELLSTIEDYLTVRFGPTGSRFSRLVVANKVAPEVRITGNSDRDLVFFSYSHKDVGYLDDLQKTLRPAFKNRSIRLWDDRQITAGQIWRDAIKDALARAHAAVLLVSRDFLASDFIADKELPQLLSDAHDQGVILMWLAIEKTLYDEAEFEKYQALNDPNKPLSSYEENDRGPEFVAIARKIRDCIFPK